MEEGFDELYVVSRDENDQFIVTPYAGKAVSEDRNSPVPTDEVVRAAEGSRKA
jgi:hypothetical protein